MKVHNLKMSLKSNNILVLKLHNLLKMPPRKHSFLGAILILYKIYTVFVMSSFYKCVVEVTLKPLWLPRQNGNF